MLDKSISQFENGASAKFISAFSNDLSSIETNYLGGTLNLILSVLLFIGAAVAALYIEWMLALPILIVSIVCILISLKYGERLVVKEKETSEENMDFVAQVKDLLNGFIVIKRFEVRFILSDSKTTFGRFSSAGALKQSHPPKARYHHLVSEMNRNIRKAQAKSTIICAMA